MKKLDMGVRKLKNICRREERHSGNDHKVFIRILKIYQVIFPEEWKRFGGSGTDQLSFHGFSSLDAMTKFKLHSISFWITRQEEGTKKSNYLNCV